MNSISYYYAIVVALLLIYWPRKDERLSWPSWLTCSGWFTHISGHPSAAGRAQDEKFASQRPTFYHCATPPISRKKGKNAERDLDIWLCQLVNTTTSVVSASLLEYEYTALSSVVHCWLGALCNYSQLLFCIAWLMLLRLQFLWKAESPHYLPTQMAESTSISHILCFWQIGFLFHMTNDGNMMASFYSAGSPRLHCCCLLRIRLRISTLGKSGHTSTLPPSPANAPFLAIAKKTADYISSSANLVLSNYLVI